MSAFMCMQLVVLEEAGCVQEYAVLFLGFAGTVWCLQAANSRATDKMCGRWLMIIIYLIPPHHPPTPTPPKTRFCAGT